MWQMIHNPFLQGRIAIGRMAIRPYGGYEILYSLGGGDFKTSYNRSPIDFVGETNSPIRHSSFLLYVISTIPCR